MDGSRLQKVYDVGPAVTKALLAGALSIELITIAAALAVVLIPDDAGGTPMRRA